jgi:apolipoprotein D and lipocalin family protein
MLAGSAQLQSGVNALHPSGKYHAGMKHLFALLLAASAAMAHAAEPAPLKNSGLAPIASLDVPRYLGTWFEIAKYPNAFQKKCVADTSAQYSLQANGNLKVLNRCRQSNGEMTEAIGEARQPGAKDSPKLEVRFAPAWLSFIPWVWGNYWVIDLDPAYQLVAVSEPQREYLWVLSRTPKVDAAAYAALTARLAGMGFDLNRLELSKQAE